MSVHVAPVDKCPTTDEARRLLEVLFWLLELLGLYLQNVSEPRKFNLTSALLHRLGHKGKAEVMPLVNEVNIFVFSLDVLVNWPVELFRE